MRNKYENQYCEFKDRFSVLPIGCDPFPPCMLDPEYEQNRVHRQFLDIEHPYNANHAHFGMTLWGDLVYDEAIKTEKTIIRVGKVIPNLPAAQYNHEKPTKGLLYGDKDIELDGTEICLLVPSCSRYIKKIDEVDKHNLVTYLMKKTLQDQD